MAFEKIVFAMKTWKDKVSGNTPVTAAELNRIEKGISDCAKQTNALGDSVSQARGDCYSSDLNDITKPGTYHVGASETLNKPPSAYGWGFLLVFTFKANYTLQVYVPDGKTGKAYWRSIWEGSARQWTVVNGTALAYADSSDQTGAELS